MGRKGSRKPKTTSAEADTKNQPSGGQAAQQDAPASGGGTPQQQPGPSQPTGVWSQQRRQQGSQQPAQQQPQEQQQAASSQPAWGPQRQQQGPQQLASQPQQQGGSQHVTNVPQQQQQGGAGRGRGRGRGAQQQQRQAPPPGQQQQQWRAPSPGQQQQQQQAPPPGQQQQQQVTQRGPPSGMGQQWPTQGPPPQQPPPQGAWVQRQQQQGPHPGSGQQPTQVPPPQQAPPPGMGWHQQQQQGAPYQQIPPQAVWPQQYQQGMPPQMAQQYRPQGPPGAWPQQHQQGSPHHMAQFQQGVSQQGVWPHQQQQQGPPPGMPLQQPHLQAPPGMVVHSYAQGEPQQTPQQPDSSKVPTEQAQPQQTQPQQGGGGRKRGKGRGAQQQQGPPPASQQQQHKPTASGDGWPKPPEQSMPTPAVSQPQQSGDSQMEQIVATTKEIAIKSDIHPTIKLKRTLGTKGRPITIETNHLAFDISKLKTAIHYDVTIEPDKPKSLLREVMARFREKHYSKRYPAFDGMKNLFSSTPLPFKDSISGQVELKGENDRVHNFKISIKRVSEINLTDLQTYLKTNDENLLKKLNIQKALLCIDIVLKQAVSSRFISVGRSYFSCPSNEIILGDGMCLYKGFYLSAVLGWKPLLNVDVANKAFPRHGPVLQIMSQMYEKDPYLESRYNQMAFEKYMKGLKVEYQIPSMPSSKRTYRVNGLGPAANRATFKKEDGSTQTVLDYYRIEKRYNIKDPNIFTLWVGKRETANKILLPVELCKIVPEQVVQRKLTANQTRNMIREAATNTDTRRRNIMKSLELANLNRDHTVNEFGFSVADRFERIPARVLAPPRITYSNNNAEVRKGVWNVCRFRHPAKVPKWTIVVFDGRKMYSDKLDYFAKEICTKGKLLGLEFGRNEEPFTNSCKPMVKDVLNIFNYLKNQKKIEFVICIINDNVYNIVKQCAELQVGILTQCVKLNTAMYKCNTSTVNNILLKINAKLNGLNHELTGEYLPEILRKPTMIMGADVTHPSPDARHIPSVAAVTSSYDPRAFNYNVSFRLQQSEIIQDLENITVEHLKFWHKHNGGSKPEHIVFYRDGVSDGEFETVLNKELLAIRNACKRVQQDNYEPYITFLVVQKRHHTRFFPNPKDSEDKNCNVPAGTCVDREITNFRAQDFYLVSHASIQGVAKPTKYRTLWDDKNWTEDELEKLTYYLCHMFARCTRSVSYPAPTYYAHLAAARFKVYLNENETILDLKKEQDRLTVKDVIIKGMPMFFI